MVKIELTKEQAYALLYAAGNFLDYDDVAKDLGSMLRPMKNAEQKIIAAIGKQGRHRAKRRKQ